ncbi:hypothetical protein SAMN02927924_02858 [Sphingobium faniae]|nr:hypothetical protein SAMN02927924_02858 [Sphingobium faniae]
MSIRARVLAARIEERFQPLSSEPLWTEYLYFFAMDEASQRAVSLHVGRCVDDLDRWRASVVAYLPDDEIAIAMVEGRQTSDRRLELAGLVVEIVEDARLWRVAFTGTADKVHRRDNMQGPHRGGTPVPLMFDLEWQGVIPLWDLRSSVGDADSYSHMHHQQIGRARGRFQCDAPTLAFSGMCVRDHSCGPRDYALVEGDFWISALFPSGRAVMAQVVQLQNSVTNAAYVASSRSDMLQLGHVTIHPAVPGASAMPGSFPADPMDDPRAGNMDVAINVGGEELRMTGELLHSAALTFYPPATEEPGTDFSAVGALQWTESLLRIRCGDEIGFGVRERIAPMASLARPRR